VQSPPTVDICFHVELQEQKTGKTYPCDPICVTADATASGYVVPRDARGFAGDRDGLVAVKVLLKPSRAVALTDVRMKSYFGEPLTSDVLQMKVYPRVDPIVEPRRK
jgi:hypothetical protein